LSKINDDNDDDDDDDDDEVEIAIILNSKCVSRSHSVLINANG